MRQKFGAELKSVDCSAAHNSPMHEMAPAAVSGVLGTALAKSFDIWILRSFYDNVSQRRPEAQKWLFEDRRF
jgi:hypothetical protein